MRLLIFINDLPDDILKKTLFAGDVKLFIPLSKRKKNDKSKSIVILGRNLKKVLKFIIEKCKIQHIGSENSKVKYKLSKRETKKVNMIKELA